MTILVPGGAEAAAVRRGAPGGAIVEVPAGRATAELLPDLPAVPVVVVGLCGALRERRVGEIVVYRHVVDDARSVVCDAALVAALLPDAARVDACTTQHVVTTRAERAALAARFDADVVDMEGTHLGAALEARGIRFAMVRVVSDDAERDLPALQDAIDPVSGTVRALHVAAAFARSPRAAFGFIRDVQRALGVLSDVARTLSP